MTPDDKARALRELHELAKAPDKEAAHKQAEDVLLCLVNDREINDAFKAGNWWYA